MTLHLILVVVAVVLFALAAFGVNSGKINLVAAGLFSWALSTIVS